MKNEVQDQDFRFWARLTTPRGRSLEVPTDLYLPKTIREKPRMIFRPQGREGARFPYLPVCSLDGEIGGRFIHSNEVWVRGGAYNYWGRQLQESAYTALLSDLVISEPHKPSTGTAGVRGEFRLTQSLLLEPKDFTSCKEDGAVEVEHGERFEFPISSECLVQFDNRYRFDSMVDGKTVMWPELVARFGCPSEDAIHNCLERLDDLLLLVSLAEGQRCACMEVTWSSDTRWVHLFRVNRAVPFVRSHHSFNNFLVEADFFKFLQRAYAIFEAHPQRSLVRGALESLTDYEPATISEEYIRLFTALESVVLAYRRASGLEFIISSQPDRDTLNEDLKEFLKGHPLLKEDKTARRRIYANLRLIERVPLAEALTAFGKEFRVNLTDLWPVYGAKEGISLAQLRNELVHGEYFSDIDWEHIIEAKSCLRVIASRCMLALLGWDYDDTRAHYGVKKESVWQEARRALSRNIQE